MKIIKQQSYVLDASVVVKWFAPRDEPYEENALFLLDSTKKSDINALFPELIVYEVSNALLRGI